MTDQALADDVLQGAAAIARYLFGPGSHPRRARTAIRHGLPSWKIGNRYFARKSAIARWLETQEVKNG